MTTTLIMDTHRLIEDLQTNGFTAQQAAGITKALQNIDLGQLATKGDLKEMELRLTNILTSRLITVVGVGVAFLTLLKLF